MLFDQYFGGRPRNLAYQWEDAVLTGRLGREEWAQKARDAGHSCERFLRRSGAWEYLHPRIKAIFGLA